MADKEGLLPFKLIEEEFGEALTSYGGLPFVVETCEALGLGRLVKQHVRIKQRHRGYTESKAKGKGVNKAKAKAKEAKGSKAKGVKSFVICCSTFIAWDFVNKRFDPFISKDLTPS